MKVRNVHCVELTLSPKELAAALGHPDAEVREAEVSVKEGQLQALRVHLEYVIATRGIPKTIRKLATPAQDEER